MRGNCGNFWQQNPGLTARWLGPTFRPITWAALGGYWGSGSTQPVYYDYGTSVVYQDDTVYVDVDSVGTQAQ